MKKTLTLTILFFALSTFFACNSSKKNLPTGFDLGVVDDGVYTNNYFGMKVKFNPDWAVQDQESMNDLAKLGAAKVSGNSDLSEAQLEASMVNTAYLLTVFEHEPGSAVDFNPSFMVIAENIKNYPGIKTGSDYLFHARKLLIQSNLGYDISEEVTTRNVGGIDFDVLTATREIMDLTIVQEYLSTISKNFSLNMIMTYVTDENKKALYSIADEVSFD